MCHSSKTNGLISWSEKMNTSSVRYKTRHRSGMSIEKFRYSPELVTTRKRHFNCSSKQSIGRTTHDEVSSSISSESEYSSSKRSSVFDSASSNSNKEQNEKIHTFVNSLGRTVLAATSVDLAYQMEKAIRLYRYMSLPDDSSGFKRPLYRPFLKRNLIYMKKTKFDAKCFAENTVPPLFNTSTKSKRLLLSHESIARLDKFVSKLLLQKEKHLNGYKNNSVLSRAPVATHQNGKLSVRVKRGSLNGGVGGIPQISRSQNLQACTRSTSKIDFIDVRHKDLPGNRKALITVYVASEINGSFGEIGQLPSATFQMLINERGTSVTIDLPKTVGRLMTDRRCREKNDYLVIRVRFSGDDSRARYGRSLRCVPSRSVDSNWASRNNKMRNSSKFLDDAETMFGARCISSIRRGDREDGLMYGNISILLVSSLHLKVNGSWRRDSTLTKRILELAKKLHVCPFVRISISRDIGDSSSSEDDDESKSSSSVSVSNEPSASASVCITTSAKEENKSNVIEDCDLYMKMKKKFEMSLKFPQQICYRFLMKYNEESRKIFPMDGTAVTADTIASVESSFKRYSENAIAANSKEEDGLMNLFSKDLQSPAEDPRLSLCKVIDRFAAGYDKCNGIAPPKPIAPDDKITVPELHYANFPEPDGDGIVTRFLSPANKCFFCMETFPDMFALMLHMRTSYPRLDIIYRGDLRKTAIANASAPVYIDVYIRKDFDCSFEGQVARQYMSVQCRNIPHKFLASNRVVFLVHKSEAAAVRSMRKDLSIFFTQSDRELRASKGNNAAYFGFRSRHPLMNGSEMSTKQTDQEWLREYIIRQIEDFVDITRTEKDFMILWNIFLLNLNHKPFGRCHVYRTCRLFLQKHRETLIKEGLTVTWVSHLTTLFEKEGLNSDELYDLTMRLLENYNPMNDPLHVVYPARSKLQNLTNNMKRELPTWQRCPSQGPKVSVLRSSSVMRSSSVSRSRPVLRSSSVTRSSVSRSPSVRRSPPTLRTSSVIRSNSVVRGSSVAKYSSGENPENDDGLNKFLGGQLPDARRNSSSSEDHVKVPRRQRDNDSSKYLFSPRATKAPKWLSFTKNS